MASREVRESGRLLGEADAILAEILGLIRTGGVSTRTELRAITGLKRAVISQRVEQAIAADLVDDASLGESTGGRAPRRLRFRSEAGVIYSAVLGTAHVCAAISDLAGQPLELLRQPWDRSADPDDTLDELIAVWDKLAAGRRNLPPVWAIGIGLPGPVDFGLAQAVSNHDLPRWNNFDIRSRLEQRYRVPVWVDNDLNIMALRELLRVGAEGAGQDFIVIKASNGIGAAIVSGGQVQRGHNGSAGAIGHWDIPGAGSLPCRCGRTGCLETVASGWALARDATILAAEGRSDYLQGLLADKGRLTPDDIRIGAQRYDQVCMELIDRSASLLGATVGALVSFLNPARVLIGGILPSADDLYLAGVRREAYRHGLPLATRDLRILPASLEPEDAAAGAASLTVEQLFAPRNLPIWLPTSASAGTEAIFASKVR